jgi:hypothetical protein
MQSKYDRLRENEQDAQKASQGLTQLLEEFLSPLLLVLETFLDKRLVRTWVQVCVAIIRFRNQKQGLLLSELGSYMDGYRGVSVTAPAGTKRISNRLRSLKWSISHSDEYLLKDADKEGKRLKELGKRILCIWDDSVREKSESSQREGFCPVVSSKAKRLNRCRKGLVFNFPPRKPVTVAGMQWTGALITGMEGMIYALMNWWSTRGEYATKLREQEEALLRKCVRQWGDILLPIFDRGYASGLWLEVLQSLKVRLVIRWKKGHVFVDAKGEEKKLWQIGHCIW